MDADRDYKLSIQSTIYMTPSQRSTRNKPYRERFRKSSLENSQQEGNLDDSLHPEGFKMKAGGFDTKPSALG